MNEWGFEELLPQGLFSGAAVPRLLIQASPGSGAFTCHSQLTHWPSCPGPWPAVALAFWVCRFLY